MIRFNNVSKRYENGHDALKHINLTLDKGEMAFLTGHSGAGKSTLLKLITLVERSTRGEVIVNDINLTKVSNRKIPFVRRNIGMIFQDHRLLYDRQIQL